MKIGLKTGARGEEVQRLQKILVSEGHEISRNEIEQNAFGPSTLAALKAFQTRHSLRQSNQITRATLNVLLELEENVIININQASTAPPTAKPAKDRGSVTGKLVDGDGNPIVNTRVSLFEMQLRTEKPLGNTKSNKQGQYAVSYRRTAAINLVARAYNATGEVLAQSATQFAAATVEIDLTTAKDGVVRTPSFFTTLEAQVAAQLQGTPLQDLKQNQDEQDLQFLASSIGAQFNDVAYLFIAHVLGQQEHLQDATLFGIFYQGIPPSLEAALGNLPDSGIDATFMAQVLSSVLTHSDALLAQALTTAVSANVLPASYAGVQASEIALLDALRVQNMGNTPYLTGKTTLNALLAAGSVVPAVQTAFTTAYASNDGQLGPTWTALRANPNLAAADLDTLSTTLQLGELFTGNLPLVADTIQRLSQKTLASVQNLALLSQSDWVARITALDPQATSITQILPTDTPQQSIAHFAAMLVARLAQRYPTTAFAGGLAAAGANSSFKTYQELSTFLTAQSAFNIHTTNIDQFLAAKQLTPPPSSDMIAELKTAQRLHRISHYYTTVEALHGAGYKSAQSVYFAGRAPFLAKMTARMGSASLAQAAYAQAHMTYATVLATYGRYNGSVNGLNLAVMEPQAPDPDAIANLPDLQALFGNLDYFQCEDCQSVYSPAAYLVDLLQYLINFSATSVPGVANATARDALFLRRPDIWNIALSCDNTNITLPYIDLVNEILEAAIAPPATPVTLIATKGTSAERRALPQQISQAAYLQTASAVFPLSLPFDLPFAQTQAYIAALGTSRATILKFFVFAQTSAGVSNDKIACAALGINPEMQAVINTEDDNDPWTRWGLSPNPASVIDPKKGTPYVPNPSDWVAALSKVPFLENRSGLSLQQLYQLLEVIWVTQSAVALQPGTTSTDGEQILSSDTDAMVFAMPISYVSNQVPISITTAGPHGLAAGAQVTINSVLGNTAANGSFTITVRSPTSFTLNGSSVNGTWSGGGVVANIGLTNKVLDRANRFLRLWTASGLNMWELDWALYGRT